MEYSFDEITPRLGTSSYKWDASLPEGVVLSPAEREKVIPLWVADMDFRCAPFIVEALQRRVSHGIFGYTSVPQSYFKSIMDWYSRRHHFEIERDWILYTSGVVPAVSATIKALTSPGDAVLVMTPVYNCFFSSIRNNLCRVEDAPLLYRRTSSGFTYDIDWEMLDAKCSLPQVKILLLCSPHNPAGRVFTEDELRRIGAVARHHGVIVVCDEIHCEIISPGYKFTPFAAVSQENLSGSITLCSPSKSFNTAGLQIANIISDNPLWREKIDRAININEVCDVNPFGVVALEASYSPEGEKWLEGLSRSIWRNYTYLREVFAKELEDLPVCELEGTYLAWIDVRSLGVPSEELEKRLLSSQLVWVNAGSMYGQEGFIRINLACPFETLREGLERVVAGLQELS